MHVGGCAKVGTVVIGGADGRLWQLKPAGMGGVQAIVLGVDRRATPAGSQTIAVALAWCGQSIDSVVLVVDCEPCCTGANIVLEQPQRVAEIKYAAIGGDIDAGVVLFLVGREEDLRRAGEVDGAIVVNAVEHGHFAIHIVFLDHAQRDVGQIAFLLGTAARRRGDAITIPRRAGQAAIGHNVLAQLPVGQA